MDGDHRVTAGSGERPIEAEREPVGPHSTVEAECEQSSRILAGALAARPADRGRPPSPTTMRAGHAGGAMPTTGGECPAEIALSRGRVTIGVVRVQDTVRRPHTQVSPFSERLLRELESAGFRGAPRWLGVDPRGRDTLSWLPGRVAAVDERLSDAQVGAAGRLLRGFHDATCGSTLAGEHETVCHGDPGPYNMVFGADDLPYALIDYDLAGPGYALEDVGLAAWLCTINSRWQAPMPIAAQARQLRLFADTYGLDSIRRHQLLDATASCQLLMIQWARVALATNGLASGLRAHASTTLTGCEREHAFLYAHRRTFQAALQ